MKPYETYGSLSTEDFAEKFVLTMKGEEHDIRVYSRNLAALVGYCQLTMYYTESENVSWIIIYVTVL